MDKENKRQSTLLKIWRAFYSMQMGIALLLVVCLLCLVGSIVVQEKEPAYYAKEYGEKWGSLIVASGADDIYNTWYFGVAAVLLGANLLLCSIVRFPALLKTYKKGFGLSRRLERNDASMILDVDKSTADAVFSRMKCRVTETAEHEGVLYSYGIKGRFHVFGSWLTHLGILVIMAGMALGTMLLFDEYVIGTKGVSCEIPDTDYVVHIEDYEIVYKNDDAVDNYITTIRVENKEGTYLSDNKIVKVNSPATVRGYSYVQNSTGWAVDAVIREIGTGKELKRQLLYPGGAIVDDQDIYGYQLMQVYPDFAVVDDRPVTISPFLNNPVVSLLVYREGRLYNTLIRAVGVEIGTDVYTLTFENPRLFTVLQVSRDPAIPLVAAGGAVLMAGLALAFYFTTLEMWAYDLPDGRRRLHIKYKQGRTLVEDKINQIVEENQNAD